ncbi:MAG: nicotinate phosphoribosyltransferase [Desulfobacterales bacterium]|nr:nicotinate phosphoribosyltransferase [Desulfobacterales bacterium]
MAAAYFNEGIQAPATFSLYVRRPPRRGFFVAAGLEEILTFLDGFRFAPEELAYLRQTALFSEAFLSYLADLRFQGDVWAMPEGSLFFGDEPIIEVTAPLIQAQLLETWLINAAGLSSLIATKAARCVHAAQGRGLMDFSLRRDQGADAGLAAARASYLAGFDSTSNVLAGKLYGIPVSGTMAHSFIQAFDREIDAFRSYARSFPRRTVLLIDTYDTVAGARQAVQVAREMQPRGESLQAVRLDSGDLVDLSRRVRAILDEAGFGGVKILASGGLDEFDLAALLAQKAPIDAFGVGTKMGVSADAPFLDIVYKMVQFDGRPVCKHSTGKVTLAGEKQVYRRSDPQGCYLEDVLGTRQEQNPAARPLLQPVMRRGRRLHPPSELNQLRQTFKANFARLPETYKVLSAAPDFPVLLSERLRGLQPPVS